MKNIDIRLVLVVVGCLVMHFALAIGFQIQRGGARDDMKSELQALEVKWEEEDKAKREQQESELSEKYGTNQLDRIALDPRMNIQLALVKMFKALVDTEYKVEVTPERFTEFRVVVSTANLPEPVKLAAVLKEALSRIDPALVYEIVFTDGDRVYIVEPYQFRSLDWKTASIEQVMAVCFPKR